MEATANSKVKSIIWVSNKKLKIKKDALDVWFPNKVINRWPAIMLADNRIARVKGRMIKLIDSISTIKGINKEGVLKGTKWANMFLVKLIQPNNINLSHKGKAKVNVITIWLVLVNT